jgi:hypothetical protein
MTAASSAKAPATIIASGKTVLVIAPLRAWPAVKLPIILVPTVMHGPGLSRRDANQTQSLNLELQKAGPFDPPCGTNISPTKGLTHYVIDQRLTSRQ